MAFKELIGTKNLHVVFDLDGTLIDSVGGIQYAMNKALNQYGLKEFDQTYYRGRVGQGAHALTSEISNLYPSISFEDLYSLYQLYYQNNIYQDTHVYDGIEEVLRKLSRSRVSFSVLTNKNHKFAVEMVKKYFPDIYFESVNGVENDGLHKPQLNFIQRAQSASSVKSTKTIFIGDTPIDIECAKVSGGLSTAVTWGYCTIETLRECEPDFTINKPIEILNIIDQITELSI